MNVLHLIPSPLSRQDLQIPLRWRSGHSHKLHFLRLIAAAGCRLYEPDRNINTMLHQYNTYVHWSCSECVGCSHSHRFSFCLHCIRPTLNLHFSTSKDVVLNPSSSHSQWKEWNNRFATQQRAQLLTQVKQRKFVSIHRQNFPVTFK